MDVLYQILSVIVALSPFYLLAHLTYAGLRRRNPGLLMGAISSWIVGLALREFGFGGWLRSGGPFGGPCHGPELGLAHTSGVDLVHDYALYTALAMAVLSITLLALFGQGLFAPTKRGGFVRTSVYAITGVFVLREAAALPFAYLATAPKGLDSSLIECYRSGLIDGVSYFLNTSPYVLGMAVVFFFAVRRGFREKELPPASTVTVPIMELSRKP